MIRFLLAVFKIISIFPWLQRFALQRMNTLFLVGVVGLIRDDRGRVILFHHTYRRTYPWGLPGGWLKRGEQPRAALKREVAEESGLEVRIGETLHINTDAHGPMVEIVLAGTLTGGSFRPSEEVDQVAFVESNSIPDAIKPSQRRIVLDALEGDPKTG